MNTSIEWSTPRADILKALFAAQSDIEAVKKTSENPHFRSKYADLATIFEAVLPALCKHDILLLQGATTHETTVEVETLLVHVPSGESVRSVLELTPSKLDPQGMGSAITYGRRYGLQPLLSIAPEDDDGNAASGLTEDKLTDALKKSVESFKPFAKLPKTEGELPLPADGNVEFTGVLESVIQSADDTGVVWTSGYLDKKRIYTSDKKLSLELLRFADCDCTVRVKPGKKENQFRLIEIK
jgi:hypothetical protein